MIWSPEAGECWCQRAVIITFTIGCLWLEFLQAGWIGEPSLHDCWFSVGFQMVTPCLISPQKCIMFSMVPLQMLQLFWDDMQRLVYRHAWKPLETCSWDIPLTLMKLSHHGNTLL